MFLSRPLIRKYNSYNKSKYFFRQTSNELCIKDLHKIFDRSVHNILTMEKISDGKKEQCAILSEKWYVIYSL